MKKLKKIFKIIFSMGLSTIVLKQLLVTKHIQESVITDDKRVPEIGISKISEDPKEQFKSHVKLQTRFSRKEIACLFKSASNFIIGEDSRWTKKVFPEWNDFGIKSKNFLGGRNFDSCAVISNSGAMLNSSFGSEIDGHDIVIRMNKAPSRGFESDVGSRPADLRILNNHVVDAKRFSLKKVEDALNSLDGISRKSPGKTAYVVWDVCQCCKIRNFEECFSKEVDGSRKRIDLGRKGTFNGLGYFLKAKNESSNRGNLFLMDFDFPWDIWTILQLVHSTDIPRNIPTSGFLTIIGMMHYCKEISAFEFLPSSRNINGTSKCHYYEGKKNCNNWGDTRQWHPRAAEKAVLFQLNVADLDSVLRRGVMRIPGFSEYKCV